MKSNRKSKYVNTCKIAHDNYVSRGWKYLCNEIYIVKITWKVEENGVNILR